MGLTRRALLILEEEAFARRSSYRRPIGGIVNEFYEVTNMACFSLIRKDVAGPRGVNLKHFADSCAH